MAVRDILILPDKRLRLLSKPVAKIDHLLDAAMEAQYFRGSAGNQPMVLIPNHPSRKTPSPLNADNYDFVSWLTWRCYKKHGFIASSALINALLRFLTGMTLYDESIPEWNPETQTTISSSPVAAKTTGIPINVASHKPAAPPSPLTTISSAGVAA